MATTYYDIVIRAVDGVKGTFTQVQAGLQRVADTADKANGSLGKVSSGLQKFGNIGAVAFAAITSKALHYADTIVDTADATDVAVSTILGLKAVTEGTKVGLDDISTALLRFNENLGNAAGSGGKELRESLSKVGVSLTDLANVPTDQLLQKVLAGLAGMEDKSKAAALAQDIFGKSLRGAPLEKFGSDLQKAIQDQQEQTAATIEAAGAADQLEKAFNRLISTAVSLLSPVTQFINNLDDGQIKIFTTAVIALGAAMLAVFAANTIASIASGIAIIFNLAKAISIAAAAQATLLALSGPAGWAILAAGAVAAGAAVLGINKLLDDNAEKQKKAIGAATNAPATPKGGKPAGPLRVIEPLKSEVKKVRNVLATAQEAYDEATSSYNQLINVFSNTKDVNLQALQFQELSRAAETLGKVIPMPTRLIERDFTLALEKSGEELRRQEHQLTMTGAMQQKFANDIRTANLSLTERELKLKDANYQQALFNNLIKDARLTQDEQLSTLAQANKAYADGRITLSEYAKVTSGIPNELKSLEVRQLEVKDAFDKGLNAQGINDQLIAYEFQLAKASGDIRQFLSAYEKYKAVFGATAEGELQAAIDGGRKDIQTTNARKKAYEDLTTQFKNGEISAKLFSSAAKDLGASESEIQRLANVHGNATDIMVSNLEYLEAAADRTATAFSDSLTNAILKGQNIFKSFRDFVGSIFNDIATRLIKQSISDPIADALSGLAKSVGGSIFSKAGGADGGSAFGSLGSWFAGLFAEGGQIGAGKIGIVGERGPEFIAGPANVTPMDGMTGGGDTFHVNFSINAIDTQTGVEFLVKNKPVITQVIEQAYNKRARRGPLTVG